MQQKLIELCIWLEAQVRPFGFHVAATGSALYGHPDDPSYTSVPGYQSDLDVVIYRHSGWKQTLWRPFDLLLNIGFRVIDDLSEYPEFEGDRKQRTVLSVGPKSTINGKLVGVKIDFMFIDVETTRKL